MVHLFNIGICRGGKLQKGIPLLPIARIPLQKVPCTGIALFTNADVIEGQGRKALLGSSAGSGIGLFGFRSRLAHIACKGLCFVLEGVLHRVADGVVGQQRIKGAYRPLPCHGSDASGKHGDQQDCGKPCRDLAAQGYTALRGFVPCHTLSLLSLQHPAFFISIIIFRGKCNCKKSPVFARGPVLAGNIPVTNDDPNRRYTVINGYPVVLSFAKEPNPGVFDRIRDILLVTSYTKTTS